MSLNKFLNKMGLTEDELPAAKPKTATAQVQSPQTTFQAQVAPAPVYTPAAAVDPAISEMLKQSLEENKLAGFDFMKFTAAVEEMKSTGATEDSRYKMAAMTAKQMGVDKASLLKSGSHYLDVLTSNENDFNNDCSQYEKKEISSRESKISQTEATIDSLSKQLAQAQQDHQSLTQELSDQKSNLDSRKSSFQVTLQSFRATIEQNINKINQYLQ